jgi:hypothetical protein
VLKLGVSLGFAALAACGSLALADSGPRARIKPADLHGHWLHAREEQAAGSAAQVFRREGSREFPPSRFRMQYRFHPGGKLDWFYLAPDDGHRFKQGRWKLEGKDRRTLRLIRDDGTDLFRVEELSKTVLRLAPVKRAPGTQ